MNYLSRPFIRWSFAVMAGLWSCAIPRSSSAPPPPDAADCGGMCAVFRRLGCAAGLPSPRLGVTCEARCAAEQSTGAVSPPVPCIAHATSAEGVRACGERCTPVSP